MHSQIDVAYALGCLPNVTAEEQLVISMPSARSAYFHRELDEAFHS